MGSIPATMSAVAYRRSLPIGDPESLIDVELPVPAPGPHDLLVAVQAVSVNPVDVKVRARVDPGGEAKVLGYDAAGVVAAIGGAVTRFAVGEEVYYAGSIDRPGSSSELQLVDERITGHKPATLSFAQAAALPLTTITAWEALLHRLRLTAESTGTLLVLAAAGGVGSMIVQLARALTGLTIVGTASRPESRAWATDLGAHHVVDHRGDLVANVAAVAPGGIDYVFTPYSKGNIAAFAELLRPYGQVVAIDDPGPIDLVALKPKSIAWHWEYMFTAPRFTPQDPRQHDLLERAAALVDAGTLSSTLHTQLSPIDAATLRRAHALVESGGSIGKVVVARSAAQAVSTSQS